MYFTNLTLYRFPTTLDLGAIEQALSECALKPVGPNELQSLGFVSPFGRSSQVFSHKIGDAIWVAMGSEQRILPPYVVEDLLARKVAAIEEKEGRKIGGRARRQLKQDLVTELLPRAFVKPGRTDAILFPELGLIAVDSSSRKVADALVSMVRSALGSFPALPINAESSPRSIMTGWLAGDTAPEGLVIGDEAELRDPVSEGSIAKLQRHELQGDEVEKHLESGKQVFRLGLSWQDRVSFVLGEDLVIRKLKLLDVSLDQLESNMSEDLNAELDARFALMSGEIRSVFDMLEPVLHFSKAA